MRLVSRSGAMWSAEPVRDVYVLSDVKKKMYREISGMFIPNW